MKRDPVNSSNLKEVGYDSRTKVLEVQFHTGAVYQYVDVPEDVYASLMSASSLGSFFHEEIRTSYHYKRMR